MQTQYSRGDFRKDILRSLASSQEEALPIHDFLQLFENVTGRPFPEPKSLNCTNDQDLFSLVSDVCKLERFKGSVHVRRLTSNASRSDDSRRMSEASTSDGDDIQEVSQQQPRTPVTRYQQLPVSFFQNVPMPRHAMHAMSSGAIHHQIRPPLMQNFQGTLQNIQPGLPIPVFSSQIGHPRVQGSRQGLMPSLEGNSREQLVNELFRTDRVKADALFRDRPVHLWTLAELLGVIEDFQRPRDRHRSDSERSSLSTSSGPNTNSGQTIEPLMSIQIKQEPKTTRSKTRRKESLRSSDDFISLNPTPEPSVPAPRACDHDPVNQIVTGIETESLLSSNAMLPREVRTESDIDTACKIISQNMAANKEYVSSIKIEKALLQYYRKGKLSDFAIRNVRFAYNIPCLKQLSLKERKINLFIDIYVEVRNLCTIYDLERSLVELEHPADSEDSPYERSYESVYQMGPLYKNPLVYDKFKFPTDGSVEPQKLASSKVSELFRNYLTKKNLWASKELQTADFLTYLADLLDVGNPWHIGIKIVSLPLLKSILSSAGRASRREEERILDEMQKRLAADMKVESDTIRKQISNSMHINTNSVHLFVEQVKLMDIVPLLNYCFSFCRPMLDYVSSGDIDSGSKNEAWLRKKSRKFSEVRDSFEQFFKTCKTNPVATALFEFALVASSQLGNYKSILEAIVFVLDNQQLWKEVLEYCPEEFGFEKYAVVSANYGDATVVDLVSDSDGNGDSNLEIKVDDQHSTDLVNDLKCQLLGLLQEALGAAVQHGELSDHISLEQLEAIENRIDREKFQQVLRNSSLLNFITSDPELLTKFSRSLKSSEDGTCFSDFSTSVNSSILNKFLSCCEEDASCEEILEALTRCFKFSASAIKHIEKVVNDFKAVPEFVDVPVVFAHALSSSVDLSSSVLRQNEMVDIALQRIMKLPFLEGIDSGIGWDTFFRPNLGALSKFLEDQSKFFGSKNVKFLHVSEKEITKIPAIASCDLCVEEIKQRNCGKFAAFLVSMVCSSGGLRSFPFQLCQSEFFGPFNSLYQYKALVPFISETLIEMPFTFVPPFFSNLFKKVAEKVGVVDMELEVLDFLRRKDDSKCLLKLGMIGNVLGIQLWTDSLKAENDSSNSDLMGDENAQNSQEPSIRSAFVESFSVEDELLPASESDLAVNTNKLSEKSISTVSESERLKRESDCEQVIRDILMQEFGEGLQVTEEAKALLDKHQERIGRSLDRLSKELYSQDVHFILELIQNADDNCYTLDGNVDPTLIFVLETDKLTVLNNESGFKPENIQALCDVGKTTKGKHRKGLIGQKGIGFKSVFRVTDMPEIHSNGFHICFDVNNGSMGMIKPKWIPEQERKDLEVPAFLNDTLNCDVVSDFPTRILLPFPTGSSNIKTFQTKLMQIEPSLLLFLNQLEKIVICFADQTDDNRVVSITRRKLSNNVVCIESKSSRQFFLVHTCAIPVPEHLNLKLEETEVCFAFPLEKGENKQFSFSYSKTLNAFAFLPVRDFGLRFIVQADFEIPSSRQDLDQDSAFNQWLALQIPELFLKSFDNFASIVSDPVHASTAFLSYLPLSSETFGYFKPVAQKISDLVKNAPVIPTADGDLCLPSESIHCSEKILSSGIIDSELFSKATGWKLAHKNFDQLRSAVLKQLGLHSVGIKDLLVTLEYFCQSESASSLSFDERILTVNKILTCIVSHFGHQLNAAAIETLRKIEFLPLNDGSWATAENNPDLFCNLERNQSMLRKLCLLKLVDQSLLFDGDNLNYDVQRLLEKIGIKVANFRELVRHHVVDVLLNRDRWSKLSQESLCDYSVFLINAWHDISTFLSPTALRELMRSFPLIILERGDAKIVEASVIGQELNLYLHQQYQPSVNLASVFPSIEFKLVHNCYLNAATSSRSSDKKQFRNFFLELGVSEFFGFRQVKVDVENESGVSEKCTNYASELIDILTNKSGNVSRAEYKQLFTLLSHHWMKVGDYLFARVSDEKLGAVKLIKSEVALALLDSCWVPVKIENSDGLAVAKDVFVKTQDVSRLFRSCDVRLLDPGVSVDILRSEFVTFLGIKTSVSLDVVLDYLRTSSHDTSFKTSLEHMACVYQYLQNHLTPECCEALQQEALIYLPSPQFPGQFGFFGIETLVMEDPTGLFGKYSDVLSKQRAAAALNVVLLKSLKPYRYLIGFFENIGALKEPSPSVYRDLMLTLVSAVDMTQVESKRDNRLHDLCNLIGMSGNEIQDSDVCFPCSNETLASIDDGLLMPDDASTILYSMFKKHKDLKIIHDSIFEVKPEVRESILHRLRGKSTLLSSAIEERIIPGQLWTCSKVHNFVYYVLPYVQRYIKHSMPEFYDLNKNILAEKLKKLKFFACKEIEVIYTYGNVLATKSTKFVFCNGKEFYIGRDYLEDWNLICKELASLFTCGRRENELALFVESLVKYFNREPGCLDLEAYMLRYEIPLLLSSDSKWQVLEPNYSEMAIELEIKRNAGDTNVTEEDIRSESGDCEEKKSSAPAPRGAGQWPPLPPRGGGYRVEPEGSSKLIKELPPPPKPPSNWHSSNVVLPPRLANLEPNRVPGDAEGSSEVPSQSQNATPVMSLSGSKVATQQQQQNVAATPNPGEKRSLRPMGETQLAGLSTSPQASAEKKLRQCEDSNPPTSDAASYASESDSSTVHPVSGGSTTLQLEVTTPSSSYIANVSCQLESLKLSKKLNPPSESELNANTSSGHVGDQRSILVGRFGEQLVYNHLLEKHPKVKVDWVNEFEEQYRPYDICITRENKQMDFIEVKSTSLSKCDHFKISFAELKFATEHGPNYFMFFVLNTLEPNATVTYFSNLKNKLDTNQVSLLLNLHK